LKTTIFDTSLKIKLSEDYKIKTVLKITRFCLKGMLQDYKWGIEYKSLSEREREREGYYKVFLKLLI